METRTVQVIETDNPSNGALTKSRPSFSMTLYFMHDTYEDNLLNENIALSSALDLMIVTGDVVPFAHVFCC